MKKVDFVYIILSVILQIVGLLLYFKEKDENENNTAISYLLASIGGALVSLVIYLNI